MPAKTFEEVYATLPDRGWLSEAEARLLWDEAAGTTGPILEVGCYYGRSTVLLAGLGRPMYCVDPFIGFDVDDPTGEGTHRGFLANMDTRGIRVLEFPNQMGLIEINVHRLPRVQVQLFKMKVEDWTPRAVGFAYLDGDHTKQGTLNQLYKALAGNPQGLAVHDVSDGGEGTVIRDACLSVFGRSWDAKVERLAVWKQ